MAAFLGEIHGAGQAALEIGEIVKELSGQVANLRAACDDMQGFGARFGEIGRQLGSIAGADFTPPTRDAWAAAYPLVATTMKKAAARGAAA